MQHADIEMIRPPIAVAMACAVNYGALARIFVVGFCVHVTLRSSFCFVLDVGGHDTANFDKV